MPIMPDLHAVLLVAVTSVVTILLRFLPFAIFSGNRKTPAYVTYLGKVLPYAIMGMLVVFCLKGGHACGTNASCLILY